MENEQPIGLFDSGIGGLSILRAIRQQMPFESILYFGDQYHVPYGPRSLNEVRGFSESITRFLLDQGAKVIVIACNAASAASLSYLREIFPDVPFVGMEPAVKPAVEQTKTCKVGVLATPATFQGALYASVVERFVHGVRLLQHTCPGLVAQIEKGELNTEATRHILEEALLPMIEEEIDTVVLGCTHYPFVIPLIEQIVGPRVKVIDPSPAIARQTERLLQARAQTRKTEGDVRLEFFTSGECQPFKNLLPKLLGETGAIHTVIWQDLARALVCN